MHSFYQKSPYVQLVFFLGIFLLCMFSFQYIGLRLLLPQFFGVSTADFIAGTRKDATYLKALKTFQLFYSLAVFFLPAFLTFLFWHKEPLRFAGLRGKIDLKWLLLSVGILLLSLPGVGYLSDLNHLIDFGPFNDQFIAMEKKAEELTMSLLHMPGLNDLIFNIVLMALIPAIAEEFFFRGVLQRILIRIAPTAGFGILLASVFFSLVHGEMFGFFPRAALGLLLGYIFYLSGNLWYAVAVHFVNNAAQVILVYAHEHQYISLDITQDSPTPWLIGLGSIFLTIGLLVFYKKKVPKNEAMKLWAQKENISR